MAYIPNIEINALIQERDNLRVLLSEAREEIINPIDGHDGGMLLTNLLDRIENAIGPRNS